VDLAHPVQSVIPSAHGAVLAVLARTTEPLSGRGVASLTRPSFGQRRVNEVLGELADAGIVLREARPPSNLYLLNRDHVAAEGVNALVGMWSTLLERMRAALDTWSTPPVAAWLYGSAARGEGAVGSDIDVLLVAPAGARETHEGQATWEQQTDAFAACVRAWSGNACELLEMSSSELEAAAARGERLVRDLRDHAVVLAGEHPRSMLRPDRP